MDAGNPGQHVEPVNQNLRLIACPHVLSSEKGRIDRDVPAGGTVADHLRAIGWKPEGLNARVYIDGELIEAARWEYAVPCAGQSVVARAIPMGGGGGKDVLRMVAMIAVVAAAFFTQQYWAVPLLGLSAGTVGGLGLAAASIIGTLEMQALLRRHELNREDHHAGLTVHDSPSGPRRRPAARDRGRDAGRAGRPSRRGRIRQRTRNARRVSGTRH